jgi:signal transduction histidine kinase
MRPIAEDETRPPKPSLLRTLVIRPFTRSLSSRVLGLVIVFALLGELAIFIPSLSTFHRNWLQEKVNAAQIAALALEAAPGQDITESLRHELLENAEVKRVALKRDGLRELRLDAVSQEDEMPDMRVIDLRSMGNWASALSAVEALFAPDGRMLRVLAVPRLESGEFIEIVIAEAPLTRDIGVFALRTLTMSLLILAVSCTLIYLTLNGVLVLPMRRLTQHIERFRDRPEDVTYDIRPSGREDEIGRAEYALAAMESEVRGALRQRARLAALGAAVAKLAHDLRNSLATAQLVTENLAASDDPKVRQTAPRLERVISRASGLAEAALRYGRAEERAPMLQRIALNRALDEAAAEALAPFPDAAWANAVHPHAAVYADADHLHRIFVNILRNGAQASANVGKEVRITARAVFTQAATIVELIDRGPGVPDRAKETLFQPFSISTRVGGSGLGLAITRELANAMGGDVELADNGPSGAIFAISMRPAEAIEDLTE